MRPIVVAGSAHPGLAEELAGELECELASCRLRSHPDGERDVEIETSVRGQPVFVVQPLGRPVGENLLELLLLADACRRAGARTVAAVVPYMGFARQDRVTAEGRPLGARVLADALGTGGFSQVLAVDLHSPVIASCLAPPVAHLTAVPALAAAVRPVAGRDAVVVAPDLGAARLAESYAGLLRLPLAVVHKVRSSPVEVAALRIAGDVRGRRPIVVDDMISTGRTVEAAVEALRGHGCLGEVVVAATHGIFAGDATARLGRPDLVRTFVTDSLPPPAGARPALEVVRLAPLLAEAVRRVIGERGLGELLSPR